MPTPKSKRIIVLSSSYSPSNIIANLNLTMNATFATPSNVTTVNVAEEASSSSSESSEYSMTFNLVSGAAVGQITLSFSGEGQDLASGVGVAKTSATTTTVPRASSGTVTPIPSPNAAHSRVWSQPALDGASERALRLPIAPARQAHVEVIRFAAANRLLVELDYRDVEGQRTTRIVEPYSLRQTQAGDRAPIIPEYGEWEEPVPRVLELLAPGAPPAAFAPKPAALEPKPAAPAPKPAPSPPSPRPARISCSVGRRVPGARCSGAAAPPRTSSPTSRRWRPCAPRCDPSGPSGRMRGTSADEPTSAEVGWTAGCAAPAAPGPAVANVAA